DVVEVEKEKEIVRARGITIRRDAVRIAMDCFIKRLQRLEQLRSHVGRINVAVDNCLGLKVKLERVQVLSWALFDFRLLLRRKFGLELSDNRLGQLALDREQVGRGTIVSFGPDVTVGACVDQLRIDANAITGALHRT